jgi:DNA polymerase-3 subunit delta'
MPGMAFKDFPDQEQGVKLLQRSLEMGRLAHGYLFTGDDLSELETLARTLAKVLNCLEPARGAGGVPIDSCDRCLSCRKIDHGNHADVQWVRPESKLRVILIGQVRDLTQTMNLKPTEAEYKVGVIVAADRLTVQAANAFLKTLEEPPAKSILILLTTDSQRILETILSRCLRLKFSGGDAKAPDPAVMEWLRAFSDMAAADQKSLLGRYRLLDVILRRLNESRERIEEAARARSPLDQYEDAEKELRDKWEDELSASVEAEYRRQRADLLVLLQRWLRDVWLESLGKEAGAGGVAGEDLLHFPQLPATRKVAGRVSSGQARENLENLEQLQRWLGTNVQEALALEVGLLKMHL